MVKGDCPICNEVILASILAYSAQEAEPSAAAVSLIQPLPATILF